MSIQDYSQSLQALEMAYRSTYGQSLESRVVALVNEYGDKVDSVFCELDGNGRKPVPCEFPVSVLYEHYQQEARQNEGNRRHLRELRKLRSAMLAYLEWNDRNGDYRECSDAELTALLHAEFYEDEQEPENLEPHGESVRWNLIPSRLMWEMREHGQEPGNGQD